MFTKSVLLAAVLALTNAEKRSLRGNSIAAKELVDIDVDDLAQDIIDEYLIKSEAQYNEYLAHHNKNYRYKAARRAGHFNWLKAEAEIQTLNHHSKNAKFAHNEMSDWTQAKKNARNGLKVPEGGNKKQVNEKLWAKPSTSTIAFQVSMTQAEYQSLYDYELNRTTRSCSNFDAWFLEEDRKYMEAQKSELQRSLTKGRNGMTAAEFDSYWFSIEQDRATVIGAITRCDNGNDGGDGTTPPNPDGCDAVSGASWIWGSDVIPAIKNQGSCGSCYAFSSAFVLEAHYAIATGNPPYTFSEQQVVDCQNNYSNCYGCGGGWPFSLKVSTRTYPLVREADYPYTAREESCKSPSTTHKAAATDVYWIAESPQAAKAELCNGPFEIALRASGAFSYYSTGVLDSRDCPYSNNPDHAVGVIGWTVKDGVEALIIRNSWGTGWGSEGGYAYLALDTGNQGYGPCGMYHYMNSNGVNLNTYNMV